MNPFGTYLREQRVAAGKSLRLVADGLGVSHVFLGEVERGVKRKLPEKHWDRLIELIPAIRREDLESAVLRSASLDDRVNAMGRHGHDLVHALARKIEADDLPPARLRELRRLLAIDDEEDE